MKPELGINKADIHRGRLASVHGTENNKEMVEEKATTGIRLGVRCDFWRASRREGGRFALVATHDRRESRAGRQGQRGNKVIGALASSAQATPRLLSAKSPFRRLNGER